MIMDEWHGKIIRWIQILVCRRDDTRGADLLLRLARGHERLVSRAVDDDVVVDAGIARRLAHEALEETLDAMSQDLRRIGREAVELGMTAAAVDEALAAYLDGEAMDPLWQGPVVSLRTAIDRAS